MLVRKTTHIIFDLSWSCDAGHIFMYILDSGFMQSNWVKFTVQIANRMAFDVSTGRYVRSRIRRIRVFDPRSFCSFCEKFLTPKVRKETFNSLPHVHPHGYNMWLTFIVIWQLKWGNLEETAVRTWSCVNWTKTTTTTVNNPNKNKQAGRQVKPISFHFMVELSLESSLQIHQNEALEVSKLQNGGFRRRFWTTK